MGRLGLIARGALLTTLSLRGATLDADALRLLVDAPWLEHLDDLDLRALAFDGLGPALDAIATKLPAGATLRRDAVTSP